jgi:hypothetical protein
MRIEIGWDSIPDLNEDITDGITASVQDYIISAVPTGTSSPAINISLSATDPSICINTCEYAFQGTAEMTSLHYSIFVTAKNLLSHGYSEARVCSNQTIGARNDLLSIDVRQSFSNAIEILCRPLTRFEGIISCEVMYRILPYADTYTERSVSVGSAGDIIPVVLPLSDESLTALSLAAYTLGGKQDVVVEGTFETGTYKL